LDYSVIFNFLYHENHFFLAPSYFLELVFEFVNI